MAIPIRSQTNEEEEVSPESGNFLSQLVRQLVGVYMGAQQNQSVLRQSHTQRQRRQRRRRRSDKVKGKGETDSFPCSIIPDLISCHHQTLPESDQDTFPLSLDIKMEIDFAYKRIGGELRQIGDGLEQNVQRRRRRHPAGRSQSSSITISLRICLPVTLLSVTILAFLKKKL